MINNIYPEFEKRICDLEYQISFQEQTINELNDALSQQQLLIAKMQEQMKYMVGKIKTIDSSSLLDSSKEPPPPHY